MIKQRTLRKIICLGGIAALLFGAGGCSPEKDDYSFPPLIYDEAAYLGEIEAARDLISLNETRANYAVALKKSERVEEALEKKWGRLAAQLEGEGGVIGRLSEELELWGFDFDKIGKDRYRIYLLFRVTGRLAADYGITIEGRLPDPSLLPEPWQEKGYQWWHFNPLPPTRFWPEGGFIVVREDIEAPDLAYELRINMDSARGRYGNQLPLGRMRKIQELPVSEDEVRTEDDPFRLNELLSCCHARTGARGELVRERYREVISGLPALAEVAEGIEYLGARLDRPFPGHGRLQLLFRSTRAVDRDYWLTLYGAVAQEDIGVLSEERRKAGKRSEEWFFPVYPETSGWKAGEPVVVTRDLALASVSYDLTALFYDREEKKAGPLFRIGTLEAAGPRP